MHCFRNSLDHGIEDGAERKMKGKAEQGQINIQVQRQKDGVHLLYSDNGRGLSLRKLKEKGIERGVLSDPAEDLQIAQMIFKSGISTAKVVSLISGRGVGMDAVQEIIEKRGGKISIEFLEKETEGFRPFALRIVLPSNCVAKFVGSQNDDSLKVP